MRWFRQMNPTARGLLIVALVALVVVVLQLNATLTALFLLAQIAFFLAIAAFLFFWWRERRGEIGMWPRHAQWAFYGAVLVIVADLAWFTLGGAHAGANAVAFVAVLVVCGVSLWRVWREQHTYR